MSLKAVITSDIHLRTTDKYSKILPTGINSRLQDRLDHLAKSIKFAIDKKADYWICLGDVFDKINPAEILRQKFIQTLAPLIKAKIPIIILIGNHDTDYKVYSFMTEYDLLNTLETDAITIIPKPKQLKLKGVDCLFIPFLPDAEVAEQLRSHKDQIVFGHFGVDGALVSGTEYIMSAGISPKLFNHHRFSFLGHYHKPQTTKKWMYVGSIAKADYGERNDKKGFIFIEATDKTLSHQFIDVKDRIFFQYTVYENEDPDFDALQNWENLKGQVIKLIFVGEEDWYLRFNLGEIRSKILKTGEAHKLFIEHKTQYESRIRVPEIDASTTWNDGIEVYCKKYKRPDMLDLGKSILAEVL
jgi:DNA repair exonuclease SbcCD nuclease subunit